MDDLITIGIPTYRRPSLLLHCLHSSLMQDYRPLEIDVSDNSPTEDTWNLLKSVTPPQGITLRYWRNSPSIGPIENQRKLLGSARGRRFVLMNDDDVLLPGAVSAMSQAFSLAPDVIVTYGHEQFINLAGELLPQMTALVNAEQERTPERTGLRRDMLVCAFWLQFPHVGYLILTEAARKVGIRSRSEVGLAVDCDFAIRLGQNYKESAHVFINRITVQSRIAPSTLSQTAPDAVWKFYDFVTSIDGLSPEEARARDRMLTRLGPSALREHAVAHRHSAALRILFSPTFPHRRGPLRMAYSIGLIAAPSIASAIRRLVGHRTEPWAWLAALARQRRAAEVVAAVRNLPPILSDHSVSSRATVRTDSSTGQVTDVISAKPARVGPGNWFGRSGGSIT